MNIKKIIIGVVGAMAMLGAGAMVLAETNSNSIAAQQKMVLEIGPEGRTLLRGTVTAVGTSSLTVKSWGGDWTVNVATSTSLMPSSGIAQFMVGDFVGVQGIASQTAAWTINATLVRDWTARATVKTNKEEIRGIIKSIMPRNWEGVASNVNYDTKTLTLTVDGVAYNITLAAGAKVVNANFVSVDFSLVKNGDKVRVYGPTADATITASVLRDVSSGMATGR